MVRLVRIMHLPPWVEVSEVTLASFNSTAVYSIKLQNTVEPPDPVSLYRVAAHEMERNDLLVIGAGSLGVRVAHRWRKRYPDSQITCATSSTAKHARFEAEGFTPALASELNTPTTSVLFCAPANYQVDPAEYIACVTAGAALARERYVFTSSTSVYPESKTVLREDSVALRLGGLYDLRRGGHGYLLDGSDDRVGHEGMANLVHYDDAAAAVERALLADEKEVVGRAFVIVDGSPVSVRQMLEAAKLHPLYREAKMPRFESGG
eukprot:IDg16892t1